MTGARLACPARWLPLAALVALCLTASPAFAACSSPAGNEGDIWYTSLSHQMVYCNGTNWISMGASSTVSIGTTSSGTANYDVRWTGATTLGTGAGYDNGTNVSIGTASTGSTFNVYGNVAIGTSYVSSGTSNGLIVQGNVGIGTTSPSKPLTVVGPASGDATAYIGNSGGYGLNLSFYNTTYGEIQATEPGVTNNINLALNPGAGNVGIGTTSPNGKLDITGATLTNSGLTNASSRPAVGTSRITGEIGSYSSAGLGADDGFLRLSAGGGTNAVKSYIDLSGFSTVSDMNENIIFGTLNTERMRINSSGNVGIGTTNPVKNVSTRQALILSNTTNDAGIEVWGSASGKLDLEEVGGNSYIGNLAPSTGDTLLMAGAGTTVMTLQGNGNVGIGTTAPQAALHVTGQIYASSSFAQGGFGGTGNNNYVCYLQNGPNSSFTFGQCSSLLKYKDNVAALSLGLETVAKLRPVSFNWKNDHRADIGFIAEEVEKVDPVLATYDSSGKLAGVKYPQMTALLAKAAQELKTMIDGDHDAIAKLKSDNDNLRAANDSEAAQIKTLTARLDALEAAHH